MWEEISEMHGAKTKRRDQYATLSNVATTVFNRYKNQMLSDSQTLHDWFSLTFAKSQTSRSKQKNLSI